jgi:hypothetical protein
MAKPDRHIGKEEKMMNALGIPTTYITTLHTDSGHGWLAVSRGMLTELGIAQKITSCSYQKGSTVYLEEDVDAVIFTKAMEKRGVEVSYSTSNVDGDSPIRGYDRYQA